MEIDWAFPRLGVDLHTPKYDVPCYRDFQIGVPTPRKPRILQNIFQALISPNGLGRLGFTIEGLGLRASGLGACVVRSSHSLPFVDLAARSRFHGV